MRRAEFGSSSASNGETPMISKRARYALHGIGFLAHKYSDVPISFDQILAYLREYSHELSFSPGYIKKIFQDLSRAGIVTAVVGRKGGYILSRPPKRLRVLDVVTVVDGLPVEQCCLLSVGGCDNQKNCGVHEIIEGAQRQFYSRLAAESAESLSRKMFTQTGARRRGRKTPKGRRKAGVRR